MFYLETLFCLLDNIVKDIKDIKTTDKFLQAIFSKINKNKIETPIIINDNMEIVQLIFTTGSKDDRKVFSKNMLKIFLELY